MKKAITISVVLFLSLVTSGCASRTADLTLVSTRNIDLSEANEYGHSSERISGQSMVASNILFFVPTGLSPDIEDAIDSAIDSTPGAIGLTDVVIKRDSYWLLDLLTAFLFNFEGISIEATALIDKERLTSKQE